MNDDPIGPGTPAADDPSPRHSAAESAKRSGWRRKRVWIPAATLLALGLLYVADLLLSGDDIPRNTVVGGVQVGGLGQDEATERITDQLADPVAGVRPVLALSTEGSVDAAAAGITLDVPGTISAASGQPLNPITRVVSLFGDREVDVVLTVDDDLLDAAIEALAQTTDRAPVEGAIALEGITPVAVEPEAGQSLQRDEARTAILDAVIGRPADPESPIELPAEEVPVTTTLEDVERAIDQFAGPALAAPITVAADGGAAVDIPVEAIAAGLRFTADGAGDLQPGIDAAALATAMGAGFDPFGVAAVDARFQIVDGAMTVLPSVDGTVLDVNALATGMLDVLVAPAPRQVAASLVPAPAEFSTEAATALGILEPVSTFTTNFTSTASGTNIRVAAAEVDGAIVGPGETFSLNGFTGPRTTAEGYVEAGIINNGEYTTGVGGGVSQFATTTFNAIFFAGLEDVFHKPHSYYISRYPAGREATVFYDSIDLSFRNDQPTGIYIQTIWGPGAITVTFWGTKLYDIESVSSERYNFRNPATRERPDDGSCAASGGSVGFDITVTRIFRELGTGRELRREDFDTTYNAQPRVVCVPVPPPPAPPGGQVPPVPPPGLLAPRGDWAFATG